MNKPIITQEEVKKLFDYNPETGDLIWKQRDDIRPWWNTRYAGKAAKHMRSDGYMAVRINDKLYLQHRIIWLWVYGYFPEKDIDHINRCQYDNKLINLREVNHTQNMQNAAKRCDNNTGIKGVTYSKKYGKWLARIGIGKDIWLGSFALKEDAIKARREAEEKYFSSLVETSLPAAQTTY